MQKRIWVLVVVASASLWIGACGGGSNGTDDAAQAAGSGAESVELTAANFSFDPDSLRVTPGKDVELTFTNEDDVQHSFTSEELGTDLVVDGGSSDEVTFTAPESGSAAFGCKFHSSMKGEVTTSRAGGGGDDDGSGRGGY